MNFEECLSLGIIRTKIPMFKLKSYFQGCTQKILQGGVSSLQPTDTQACTNYILSIKPLSFRQVPTKMMLINW